MGYYQLPTYRPDGLHQETEHTDSGMLLMRPRLYVDVTRKDNILTISGNPLAVKQLHSYFTGIGWEAYEHPSLSECVSDCVDNTFTLDITEAKNCLMREKIGIVYFDLIVDGLCRAANDNRLAKTR
jgi:hypothetical protein